MKTKTYAILFSMVIGCGGQEKISWETQEAARQQAIDNSEFNAKTFRNANYPNMNLRMRGDSSIGPDCKEGDGWGSVDIIPTGDVPGPVVHIKCSTVSASIGCMLESDFKARPQYANQDGVCNKQLPFPLPKIQK